MTRSQSILVTGGAGYIGSHTVVELQAAGHEVFIADNLCNSNANVIDRIATISGRKPGFAAVDLRDRDGLRKLFSEHSFNSVLHFAGLKAVGESVSKPLEHCYNNVFAPRFVIQLIAASGL